MPAACPVTRAPVEARPLELLADIVEYLAPAERWRAASVSHDFRAAAHVAGFAIQNRLNWHLGRPIRDALAEISGVLGIRGTRIVRLTGSSAFWEQSLAATPTSSLSARLRSVALGAEVIILPDHRKWRRIVVFHGSRETEVFSTRPTFSAAVTYVRLDCNLIGDFLDAACDRHDLLNLCIDMCSPGGYKRITTLLPAYPPVEPDFAGDPYYYVPCPALLVLTVFALDVPAEIDPLEAVHLGRALVQVSRRKDERARLVFVGCVLSNSDSVHSLLDQAFSVVQLRLFAGRDSVEDRQCILWGV